MRKRSVRVIGLAIVGLLAVSVGAYATWGVPPSGRLVIENECRFGPDFEGVNPADVEQEGQPEQADMFTGFCEATDGSSKLNFVGVVTDARDRRGFEVLTGTVSTAKGDITIAGGSREGDQGRKTVQYAITGGTGEYAGARGYVDDTLITDNSEDPNRPAQTFTDTFYFMK
jgi:hypothetical protein